MKADYDARRVWEATVFSQLIRGSCGDNVKHAAKIADAVVEQWKERFGDKEDKPE